MWIPQQRPGQWRGKQAIKAEVFSQEPARQQREQAALETELYEQIGRLKMEFEWLKKATHVH